MTQDPAVYAAGQAQQIATLVTAPADVAGVQAWGKPSDRVTVIDAMTDMIGTDLRPQLSATIAPRLVMGSWIGHEGVATMDDTRAVYERQYKTLSGVQTAMSPGGRPSSCSTTQRGSRRRWRHSSNRLAPRLGRGAGWEFAHVAIDDPSRAGFVQTHPD